ncbi:glycosyltransferase family 2 protein [Methyloceanibacter sp. wino2]|uniref:glycosyltransferase family 2 protein n=1 Tax=Methyloceanibacter sp. wino2 TaxID=2170729 RepID=UPI000D3E32AF|nr:glycosyltransferase family 2 protein [Methyloceanibacter sp. wino2]
MSLVYETPAVDPPEASAPAVAPLSASVEYSFLARAQLHPAALAHACRLAEQWGVPPHEVLIAAGHITEEAYMAALASSAGVAFVRRIPEGGAGAPGKAKLRQCLTTGILQETGPARRLLLGFTCLRPFAMRALLARLAPLPVALVPPRELRRALAECFGSSLAQGAISALKSRRPNLSAHHPASAWQVWALVLGCLALMAAGLTAPIATAYAVSIGLALVFVPVIVFRLLAAFALTRAGPNEAPEYAARDADRELPTYTILAPLYREAHMLRPLLHALSRLDWPAAKLDIKLILEAADTETVAAAHGLRLPANVELVVVPDRGPRTKPKALNFALPLARGDYLVVYDAEDRPEPDQLRRAYQAFRAGPPNLATVQARLNIYNPEANWLTRQFTIEYSALFDGLLPLLDTMDLPIPLGGTSNHFRVEALKWLQAWDPYNVTEDADLGARLSRFGYRCTVIGSTTYEEAPVRLGGWIKQRTRWLKGFIQTWLVHMRAPRTLFRELGPRGFLAFQIMIGGTILSALVHPWFYGLLALELAGGGLLALPQTGLGLPFWTVSLFSLVAGYATAMGLGALALRHRGLHGLLWQVPLMPLYWLLISVAAYRAVWQFAVAPFKWEKTEHGSRAKTRASR